MLNVYWIVSTTFPQRADTGFSADLRQRLIDHNRVCKATTAPFRPWCTSFYAAFEDEWTARRFEQYLKSGSGHAFANKRLWPPSETGA